MKHLYFLLFILTANTTLLAQNYPDCPVALEICSKQSLTLRFDEGAGQDPTELNDASCFGVPGTFNFESRSAWIHWKVAQSGSFWFTLFPSNADIDLDFVLYRLPTGQCSEKTIVRCMAAGLTPGNNDCQGPTGLDPAETDISGPAGCAPGANNFLAAVDMLAGEEYVLAINNFSASDDSVQVDFCGSALLGCDSVVCTVLAAKNPESENFGGLKLIPNPVESGQTTHLQVLAKQTQSSLIRIQNAQGIVLKTWSQNLVAGENQIELSSENLHSGVYFISILGKNNVVTSRWIIN